MRAKPPSVPSALARREAVRNRLAGAVDSRDAQAVLSFTGQWVHRQGMASLPTLMAELAQGETLLWWQQLLQPASEPVGLVPGPAAQAAPAPEPPALSPAPALQAHQDPAPSSLASVATAEMDPDREGSQTAEIPATASKPGEPKPEELPPEECNPNGLNPVAASDAPGLAAAPAPVPAPTPTPTTAKAPVPMAMAVAPAPRQPAAQVRRGAGTSRPAPAPRNPELARLRAWLPDHDSLGGSSRRSHAA